MVVPAMVVCSILSARGAVDYCYAKQVQKLKEDVERWNAQACLLPPCSPQGSIPTSAVKRDVAPFAAQMCKLLNPSFFGVNRGGENRAG